MFSRRIVICVPLQNGLRGNRDATILFSRLVWGMFIAMEACLENLKAKMLLLEDRCRLKMADYLQRCCGF